MSKYFLLVVVLFLAGCAPKNNSAAPQPTQPASAAKTSPDTDIATAAQTYEITVGVVVVDVLNVREGPGTNHPTISSLSQGQKFYILGETINSTSNKWLLISLSDNSFGWVIGEQSYVAIQKETVDSNTYSTWQKDVNAAKSAALIPVTGP